MNDRTYFGYLVTKDGDVVVNGFKNPDSKLRWEVETLGARHHFSLL